MCIQPGNALLRIDRERGIIHGFRVCGCGEVEVAISAEFHQRNKSMGIPHAFSPNLRGNSEFLGDPSITC